MRKLLILAISAFLLCGSAFGASLLGVDPHPSLVVNKGGIDWVWAAPCAPGGCGTITLHHDWKLPTATDWAVWSDLDQFFNAFNTPTKLCGAAYFSNQYDHCDASDVAAGYVYNSPLAAGPQYAADGLAETFLVRGEAAVVPEPGSFALLGIGLAAVVARVRRG